VTKAEIQLVRSLEDKRAREETGLFLAEGEKLVGEILGSGFRVRKVFYTEGALSPSLFERHRSTSKGDIAGPDFEPAGAKDMERASRLKSAASCLALVEIPRRKFDPAALGGQLTLALDGVQNPGNLGTVIRLADWFGISRIVCSTDCADCWSPKVVQATMGAITRVTLHYGDLVEMIGAARAASEAGDRGHAGLPVYGTFLEGENIYSTALSGEGIVVMGSEGGGISAEVGALVTAKLFIPPFRADNVRGAGSPTFAERDTGPESLNVAVAAAIVCSEFRRGALL
jgi:TrmH family RNA methyltransferase